MFNANRKPMNVTGFTDIQKQALMDLLVLGMYSDGNLASAEDARIQNLLDAIHFPSEYDQQKFTDASITRVRQHDGTPESTRLFVVGIAKSLSTPEIRRQACDALDDLLASDGQVTDQEGQFMAVVREVFQL